MSAYLDRTEVRGFGDELILYKRADLNVETWWYRAKVDNQSLNGFFIYRPLSQFGN